MGVSPTVHSEKSTGRRGCMPKKILTVGFDLVGDNIESATFSDKNSLLDWDIVLFRPNISQITTYAYGNDEYLGKLCLNDSKSFALREACAHWRREITQGCRRGQTSCCLSFPASRGVCRDRVEIHFWDWSQSKGDATRRIMHKLQCPSGCVQMDCDAGIFNGAQPRHARTVRGVLAKVWKRLTL